MDMTQKYGLDAKDYLVLKSIERHQPQWVDLDASTASPKQPLAYYENGKDYGDDLNTGIKYLGSGSGLGIMPDGYIYAVRFHGQDTARTLDAIHSVMVRAGLDLGSLPPVTANKNGDVVALFLLPYHVRGNNLRNIVSGIELPGRSGKVTLYLGAKAIAPFLGPVDSQDGFYAVVENSKLQELDPSAWAGTNPLVQEQAAFLTVNGSYRRRLTQARNHLKSILADVQPLDEVLKIVEIVAADLVACFQINPHDALELLKLPLGKKRTGYSFLEGLGHRLPASRSIPQDRLRQMFEEAVDAVPPLGVTALKRNEAKAKLASLLDTLAHIPSPNMQTMISAERFRLAFCELSGVDPQHINQTVFGTMLRQAIQSGRIQVEKERFIHLTKGDHTTYLGIDETVMKQALYWQQQHQNLAGEGDKPKKSRGSQHW